MGGYAWAFLVVVCALTVRLALAPILGDRAPFIFFFMAIVAAKRFWGRGPALLATLLGGISAWYFILAPSFSFAIANRADALNLAAYLAVGAGISFLGEVAGQLASFKSTEGQSVKIRILRQTTVLVGAAAVLLGMVVMLLHEFRQRQEAEFWVTHTYHVLDSSESLLSAIKGAEASQRGFLLTGDETYLAPYDDAVGAVPGRLRELQELIADNSRQQARLMEISRLADERMARLGRTIELYKSAHITTALAQIRTGQGRQAMDQLRIAVNAFRGEELDLLERRQAAADVEASRERWVLGLGCGALIALLVLASAVIERDTVRREEITAQVRRHADLLEQAHDSLLTCRLGGGIAYWSRGAETLFGYTREEAVGHPPHELLQSSHPYGMERIDALLERDGRWQGELTQIAKDGRKLIVEAQWTVAVDARGDKTVLEANRDITERKQAEGANLLLATAIEQAAETVVVTDRKGTIQYVNPAFTRTTGYGREEALGQNPRVLKSGQHDAAFYRQLWSTLEAGRLWHGEFINRRKDGILFAEEATIAPVRAASGEITNYIAIKSDITERRKAQDALRESEMMLRFFVRHAPAAIAMLDREMRYLVVSERWMTDYHLGNRNVEGQNHYELFPEIPERWKEIHRRCLSGALERCEEDPFPRADGHIDWVRWEVRPWRRIDDSIGGIIIFSELITERKQAEAALAESELRYRELFERSESALAVYEIIYDAQRTPCDFRYININPAFERSTTRKSSQVIGRTAREVTPEIENYWIKLFGKVAITGEPAVFEHYARHLGRYYSGIAYSLRANQVAVSFMDFTERKQAEEEVRHLNVELEERVRLRTAELESANRELEAFAHSVSHDLRAPLRGIDGWSLALLEDCNERLDPQGRKYLDRVRSEAQRMGKLIDDLLHLSRVGRAEMVYGPVDLTGLAQTMVDRLREANPGRSIEFIIAPALKCTGDARLLEVALTNLFENAAKFTCPVGSARIEFGQIEPSGNPTFFVRDNGVGFDMTYAKMLFAPFQRLHKTSEFPGTGIGLATVQRVIHRHGGRIWADAKVGAGATFYFTLGAEHR